MDNRFFFSKLLSYIIMLLGSAFFLVGLLFVFANAFPYNGTADLALFGLISLAGIALIIIGISLLLLHRIEENTHMILHLISKGVILSDVQAASSELICDEDLRIDERSIESSRSKDMRVPDVTGYPAGEGRSEIRGFLCADCGCPVRKEKERCPICGSEKMRPA